MFVGLWEKLCRGGQGYRYRYSRVVVDRFSIQLSVNYFHHGAAAAAAGQTKPNQVHGIADVEERKSSPLVLLWLLPSQFLNDSPLWHESNRVHGSAAATMD